MKGLLVLTSLMFLAPYTSSVQLEEKSSGISVKQSVDEDIKLFADKVGLEKYLQFDSSSVYEPIVLYFAESGSSEYLDLIYILDPLNQWDCKSLYADCYVGNNSNYEEFTECAFTDLEVPLYFSGQSSDKKIKRYAMNLYSSGAIENYRSKYPYRFYEFVDLHYKDESGEDKVIDLFSKYLFNSSGTVDYSTSCNVTLGDPHCWSYHFDEDSSSENWWEGFKETFGYQYQEQLRDQLFYSFYFKDWKVSQIQSVDLSYKKVLLEGTRANKADYGTKQSYYQGPDYYNFAPKYYSWNDSNSNESLDKTNYLGSSLSEIAPEVPLTNVSVYPENVSSVGMKHDYRWNKIQNIDAFKKAFGEDSGIYQFATQFMTEDDKDYWIINFDDFYYNYGIGAPYTEINGTPRGLYTRAFVEPSNSFQYLLMPGTSSGYQKLELTEFGDWLLHGDFGFYEETWNFQKGKVYDLYYFQQEYVFDVKATSITFDDSNGITYSLPTSVAKVNEEASGGKDENVDILQEIQNAAVTFKDWITNLFSKMGGFGQWILKNWPWLVGGIIALILVSLCVKIYKKITK